MIFLILVPIFTTLIGLALYRFQGNTKEIFKLDIVQFVYLFIMAPTLFVWMKSFIFYLVRNELEFSLTINQIFLVDTIFSVISIIIMSGIAIHSLTKTFQVKRFNNPDLDIFKLSEYFHLWWSHMVIWGGLMLVVSFAAITNVFVPLSIYLHKYVFIFAQSFGISAGLILFIVIWLSDPNKGRFMHVMKLSIIFFSLLHIVAYFVFSPKFDSQHIIYWFSLSAFVSAALIGSVMEKYQKVNWIKRLFAHAAWGDNYGADIFNIGKIISKTKKKK